MYLEIENQNEKWTLVIKIGKYLFYFCFIFILPIAGFAEWKEIPVKPKDRKFYYDTARIDFGVQYVPSDNSCMVENVTAQYLVSYWVLADATTSLGGWRSLTGKFVADCWSFEYFDIEAFNYKEHMARGTAFKQRTKCAWRKAEEGNVFKAIIRKACQQENVYTEHGYVRPDHMKGR